MKHIAEEQIFSSSIATFLSVLEHTVFEASLVVITHLHVVRQNPQPGEIILQKYVDGDELEIRTQERFVVARIGARDE